MKRAEVQHILPMLLPIANGPIFYKLRLDFVFLVQLEILLKHLILGV